MFVCKIDLSQPTLYNNNIVSYSIKFHEHINVNTIVIKWLFDLISRYPIVHMTAFFVLVGIFVVFQFTIYNRLLSIAS